MKKSRLNLFKSTSMLISVLGVIMIILMIVLVAYVGFNVVSSSLTGGISSGTQYYQLADLNANYTQLESQFNATASKIYAMDDIAKEQELVNAQVELVRAQNDLESVQSALDAHQSSSEVDSRLEIAKNDLKVAWDAYNSLSVK
jgi:outer membrane murein-binding lipoprotein Lpp